MNLFRPLCVATLCIVILSGCNSSDDTVLAIAEPLTVSVFTLEPRQAYTIEHRYAGTVEVKQNSALGFEAGGKLALINVNEGASVKAGQVLARLDTQLLEAETAQLQAQRNEIKARLKLAKASLNRFTALQQKGYASAQNLDELNAEVEALQASVAVTDSALAANRLRLEKSVLHAPFEARIAERLADEGEVVAAGQPVLQLLSVADAEVSVGLPPEQASALREDRLHTLHAGQRTLQARLLSVGADLNPGTRTLQARLMPLDDTGLVNGELVQLSLPQDYAASGFSVPLSALTEGVRGLWNLYALKQTDAGTIVEARDIRVLHSDQQTAYITGAITGGEQIIVSGLHRVVPGQKVSPANPALSTEGRPE